MGDNLKPCPWCGRVPVAADISGGGPAYWVECYRCEATGPVDTSSSLDNAADAWNRRPAEDALRARAEAAEADLSAPAATVGAAVVASALAPGESLSAPPQHIIVSQVNRLRARAEAAEQRTEAAEAEAARLRSDRSALIVAALVGSNVGRTLPLHCRPMLDRLAAEVVAIVGADDREALGAYVEALLLAEAQPDGEVSR